MLHRSLAPSVVIETHLALLAFAVYPGAASLAQEPPSGGSNVEITTGEAVAPSEFVGDVRDLPQAITPEERKLFHPPLEPEFDLPRHKKPLPGAQPGTETPRLRSFKTWFDSLTNSCCHDPFKKSRIGAFPLNEAGLLSDFEYNQED